jgi:hypothetical protein
MAERRNKNFMFRDEAAMGDNQKALEDFDRHCNRRATEGFEDLLENKEVEVEAEVA